MTSSSSVWRSVSLLLVAVIGFSVGRLTTRTTDADRAPALAHDPAPPRLSTRGTSSAGATGNEARGETGISPENRWNRWSHQPRNAVVDRELSAAIEEMARHTPERALALAAQEPNLRSRELLRDAALRGWAVSAPDAALAAAMKLPAMDNRRAIDAVLDGAAQDPNAVLRLGRQISEGGDAVALDYGTLAITALAKHGHFDEAVQFATTGPVSNQAQWLNEAFGAWAREQPLQALAALEHVSDPDLRREARQGLVSGWAESDPASLADYAAHEPAATDRTLALGQALTNWVLRDPVAASQWLSQRDADPALDSGLATVATLPALMAQRPEIAAEWATAISDPQQRASALRTIGDEWRRRSPTTLRQFLQANGRLNESDRTALGQDP